MQPQQRVNINCILSNAKQQTYQFPNDPVKRLAQVQKYTAIIATFASTKWTKRFQKHNFSKFVAQLAAKKIRACSRRDTSSSTAAKTLAKR